MEIYRDKYNMMYYNQLLRADEKFATRRYPSYSRKKSFTSQEVHIEDFVYAPEDWENLFYTLYFIFIPYVTGAVFLFFAVANADYENFMLLDLSAFAIVWIIGYEIVATLLLFSIFIMWLRYDSE